MMGNLVVIVISAAILAWLWWKADRPLAAILTLAYLLRLLVLYADTYHLLPNPFTGLDTEDFDAATLAFLNSDGPIKTNYTYVLAVFYRIFGDWGRFMSQFFNVLLSFGAVLLLNWTMCVAGVSRRIRLFGLALLSIMPATVCLSGVLLREAWIQFFVMLSVAAFVYWYVKGSLWAVPLSMAAIVAAMLMHVGCVGVMVVLMIGFMVCRTWKTVGVQTYLITSGMVLVFLLPLLLFPQLFTAKIAQAAATGNALDVVPVVAGSTYLLWMQKLGVGLRLLLSPVRMFYLLFSPLPFEWRELSDVVVFCVDSLFYIVLTVMMFLRPLRGKTVQLKRFLIYAVLVVTLIFSIGTSNAGTAVRHRAKFLPVMVLAAAVSMQERREDVRPKFSSYFRKGARRAG
jgi:hypothetical protein